MVARSSLLASGLAVLATQACGGSTALDAISGSTEAGLPEPEAAPPESAPEVSGDGSSLEAETDVSVATEAETASPGPVFFKSGTRLKVRNLRSEGTVVGIGGLFDSLRNEPCLFWHTADGTIRCLPNVGTSYSPQADTFADSACTQPAVVTRGDCSKPAMRILADSNGCPNATAQVYRLKPGATRYHSERDGKCSEDALSIGETIQTLGDEVSLTDFVSAKEILVGDGRLSRRVYVTEDGAAITVGATDNMLGGARCDIRPSGPTTICLPSAQVEVDWYNWYQDEQCSTTLLALASSRYRCEKPVIGLRLDHRMDCNGWWAIAGFFEPGAPVTGKVYDDSGGACLARQTTDKDVHYSFTLVGNAVSENTIAQLNTVRSGSGRLRPSVYEAQDGFPIEPTFVYFDTELETECLSYRTEHDGIRCAPLTRAVPSSMFGDPACTKRLALMVQADGCAPPGYGTEEIPSECEGAPAKLSVFRLAPPTRELFALSGENCAPAPPPEAEHQYFAIGESIPLDHLAEFEEQIDP
jgi:hypothetical protein